MQTHTLEGLFSNPVFLFLFATILVVIGNVIVGVSILPKDKRRKGYKFHRYLYYLVIALYTLFLISNHYQFKNSWIEYGVFVYFLALVPWSRKVNVSLHAIISSVGLALLMLVAVFGIL